MSCAYQYGVETTAQPAASANVSAPEAICSRFAVRREEDVGLSRADPRARRPRGTDRRRRRGFRGRARRHAARASGGIARLRDARRRDACGRRSCRRSPDTARSIAGRASITVSIPLPGEMRPNVESRKASTPATRPGRPSSRMPDARAMRRAGAPCGTTRTFSSGRCLTSTSRRSAVSVITITSSASPQSSVSTSVWCGVGSESTVCRVTTSGCASSWASESTYSPSRPPKIPYSCWSSTTSTSSRPSIRAVRT